MAGPHQILSLHRQRRSEPQYAVLQNALAAFLGEYGKEPNGVARISVIIAFDEADDEGDLVDLLVRVIRRLDGAKQARILTALRA